MRSRQYDRIAAVVGVVTAALAWAAATSLVLATTATAPSWTWLSGSSLTDDAGAYGSRGVTGPGSSPPARQAAALTIDSSPGAARLALYGGRLPGTAQLAADLWTEPLGGAGAGAAVAWTWLAGSSVANAGAVYATRGVAAPSNAPGALVGHSLVADTNGTLWLFGGSGIASTVPNDALWTYAGGLWTWVSGSSTPGGFAQYGSLGVAAATNLPGCRQTHAAVSVAAGQAPTSRMLVFGGAPDSGTATLGDLWELALGSRLWTWLAGGSNTGSVAVYGARGVEAAANDPGARCGHAMAADAGGDLYLSGGTLTVGSWSLGDVWRWRATAKRWTWLAGASVTRAPESFGLFGAFDPASDPGARSAHSLALAPAIPGAGPFLLLFGGDATNSLWALDAYTSTAAVWAWLGGTSATDPAGVYGSRGVAATTGSPGSRSMHAAGWDASGAGGSSGGRMLMFGGHGTDSRRAVGTLNDLWSLAVGFSNSSAPATNASTIASASSSSTGGASPWPVQSSSSTGGSGSVQSSSSTAGGGSSGSHCVRVDAFSDSACSQPSTTLPAASYLPTCTGPLAGGVFARGQCDPSSSSSARTWTQCVSSTCADTAGGSSTCLAAGVAVTLGACVAAGGSFLRHSCLPCGVPSPMPTCVRESAFPSSDTACAGTPSALNVYPGTCSAAAGSLRQWATCTNDNDMVAWHSSPGAQACGVAAWQAPGCQAPAGVRLRFECGACASTATRSAAAAEIVFIVACAIWTGLVYSTIQ